MLRASCLSLAALGLLASACSAERSAPPAASAPAIAAPAPVVPPSPAEQAHPRPSVGVNLFANPGFESGPTGWTHMGGQNWGAFDIVPEPAHGGGASARLTLRAAAGEVQPASKVFGVVQELRPADMPGAFPETLSGWYRVERWNVPADGATLTYLQAVVIAWGDPRTERLVGAPGIKNYQIRFVLAGADRPAFQMSNARYDFVGRGTPPLGEWVRFEIPVRRRFQESWGVVPEGYEFLRVLVEARWDHRPQAAAIDAVVHYDDLFFGYGPPPAGP